MKVVCDNVPGSSVPDGVFCQAENGVKVLAKSLLHRCVESPEDSGGSTTVTLHTRHLGLALKLSSKSEKYFFLTKNMGYRS